MEDDRKGLRVDPRYVQATKEAVIGLILFVLNFLWWYGFAYTLGSGSPDKYTYVLGFPAWFFWSCIVGFVVFSIAATWVVARFFKDIPLD
ncbi:MAG: YhdT family protein [Firmicutes bacterium]|nr:YhdT family protein [Bacillota bacterium]